MPTLRFTRDELVEALEARRPWAEKVDAERLAEHQKAEREYLARFRAACREAAKWDYQTAKARSFVAQVPSDSAHRYKEYPPDCPKSLVTLLDRQLAIVRATRQERMQVTESGTWDRVFYLLTHDENAKAEMC